MSELNLEFVDNIVKEIEAVHKYIDDKVDSLAKYANEQLTDLENMSKEEKAKIIKKINEYIAEITAYVEEQTAFIQEKIDKYIADMTAYIAEQLAILKPIMEPPTSIGAVISWATSVANYFAGPYYKMLKMQQELITAILKLTKSMIDFTTHDHFAALTSVQDRINNISV